MLSFLIIILFRIVYLIILVAVLLSWIQIFDPRKEPIATIMKLYDYIMAPFKAVIPPIGMIDISPLIAFILLQILERLIVNVLLKVGL